MYKIVTPVSHLFFKKANADKISKYSDYLEIRERTINLNFEKERFFHCDQDLTLPWSNDFKSLLEKILIKKTKIKYITFQATRCCARAKIKNEIFILSGKKFSKNEMLKEAKKNLKWMKKKFGNNLKIGLENNNYYPTSAYDIISEGSFISEVIRSNKLFFLFDLAHAQVTASNKNIKFDKYIDSLPMNEMLQMHICKPKISKKISKDTHYLPDDRMFQQIKIISKKYRNLKFFTIEYYKDAEKLISVIKKLKKVLKI